MGRSSDHRTCCSHKRTHAPFIWDVALITRGLLDVTYEHLHPSHKVQYTPLSVSYEHLHTSCVPLFVCHSTYHANRCSFHGIWHSFRVMHIIMSHMRLLVYRAWCSYHNRRACTIPSAFSVVSTMFGIIYTVCCCWYRPAFYVTKVDIHIANGVDITSTVVRISWTTALITCVPLCITYERLSMSFETPFMSYDPLVTSCVQQSPGICAIGHIMCYAFHIL